MSGLPITDVAVPVPIAAGPRGLWPLMGAALFTILLVASVIGPRAWGIDPAHQDLSLRLAPPVWRGGSWQQPLGTDTLGRDLLARVLVGTRTSLIVGGLVMLFATAIGVLLGIAAGYLGGVTDRIVRYLADVQLALPAVVLAIGVAALLRPSLRTVVVVLAATGWVGACRVTRVQAQRLRVAPYVEAARATGGSRTWIARKHLLPNLAASIVILATQALAAAVLFEAALTYLGVGLPPSRVSLGGMSSDGRDAMLAAPWVVAVPGVAIALLILSLVLVGEGLRQRFDPVTGPAHS